MKDPGPRKLPFAPLSTSDLYMVASRSAPLAVFVLVMLAGAQAQVPGSSGLPPTPPTQATAPLAAASTPAGHTGARRHRAQVSCAGGQLEVRADNSSLNGILRAVAECTGMKITGSITDQRVFGNYGPAMPATVLATLLDGTETNILLRETASDQPAELILTPRTGGPTPPNPTQVAEEDVEDAVPANAGAVRPQYPAGTQASAGGTAQTSSPAQLNPPGTVSGPVSIPQPINNVMGSPENTSPNAATYPTTNSVPLDSLPTPSTTPNQTGIVTAPNPPAAGSDTAALLNGRTTNMPGNTTITDQPSSTIAPAPGTNNDGTSTKTDGSGALTPQQVFEQLQKLRQAAQPSQPDTTTSPQPQ